MKHEPFFFKNSDFVLQLAASPSSKQQSCAGAAILAMHVVIVQAGASEELFDSGVDWDIWTSDANERVAEAAQGLIDSIHASNLAKGQRRQNIPILPLPDSMLTTAGRHHVPPSIPSPASSFTTSPLAPPSVRGSNLPSKQVQVEAGFSSFTHSFFFRISSWKPVFCRFQIDATTFAMSTRIDMRSQPLIFFVFRMSVSVTLLISRYRCLPSSSARLLHIMAVRLLKLWSMCSQTCRCVLQFQCSSLTLILTCRTFLQ
jgi:hypothetical protein